MSVTVTQNSKLTSDSLTLITDIWHHPHPTSRLVGAKQSGKRKLSGSFSGKRDGCGPNEDDDDDNDWLSAPAGLAFTCTADFNASFNIPCKLATQCWWEDSMHKQHLTALRMGSCLLSTSLQTMHGSFVGWRLSPSASRNMSKTVNMCLGIVDCCWSLFHCAFTTLTPVSLQMMLGWRDRKSIGSLNAPTFTGTFSRLSASMLITRPVSQEGWTDLLLFCQLMISTLRWQGLPAEGFCW